MEERIEGAGTDVISVVRQFFHHSEAEDGLMGSVDEHVDADQPMVKFALMTSHNFEYIVILP